MENEICLSEREILHIIGTLGKDEFFGIHDVFIDMNEFEIETALISIEDGLIDKGYAELSFDGNFTVNDFVAEILLACADCDKYLDVQINGAGKSNVRKSVYRKDDKTVEFTELSDGRYSIAYKEPLKIKEEIFADLNWIKEKSKATGSFLFTQKMLLSAKEKAEFGAAEELAKECMNPSAVRVIANGLNGNSNYYSFTMFDFTKNVIGIDNLMILNSADGSLEIEPESAEAPDAMVFKQVDYDAVKKRIENTFEKLYKRGETDD